MKKGIRMERNKFQKHVIDIGKKSSSYVKDSVIRYIYKSFNI